MTTAVHPYVEALLSGSRDVEATPHPWLDLRRGAALERANALSVPTTRDEDWRFTDLSQLTRLPLKRAAAPGAVDKSALDACAIPEAAVRLVFVDGFYVPELSVLDSGANRPREGGDPGSAPVVLSLREILQTRASTIEPHLTRLAPFEKNVFAALNTAHLRDGAVVIVPRDAACERPVHIVHFATQPGSVSYPRCLVVADRGSRSTVIEEFVGLADDAYFVNAVSEIAVAASAHLRHIKLQ